MFKTKFDLFDNACDTLINSICIGFLAYAYLYTSNKFTFVNLIEKTTNLEYKQDILHQTITQLQHIIQTDNVLQSEQTKQLTIIQKEIRTIKQILESNKLKCKSDINRNTSVSDVSVSDISVSDISVSDISVSDISVSDISVSDS